MSGIRRAVSSRYTPPEENTVGVVLGQARRARSGGTGRRFTRAATHRAGLGSAFLGLGVAILVGLRAVFGLSWFIAMWNEYERPYAALAAWVVLVGAIVAAYAMARLIGDRLPDWMLGLFLAGLGLAVALDVIAVWDEHDLGRTLTAGATAGMALLIVVTQRGAVEVLAAAGVLGFALAVLMFLSATPATLADPDWVATQLNALALAVLPPMIGVAIVEGFRRMVQVEIDRVLVQSTVSAPRFAVGMLASEELARLDLAAEELLEQVAADRTPIPLPPRMASIAAQLATELRLHLIEGRRETWLYHAISESEQLGTSVTLVDKAALAGLLDPGQRDGLLQAAWLLVVDDPKAKPRRRRTRPGRTITIEIGPVPPAPPGDVPEHKIAVPITITSTGIPRNRVDPAVWDAIGRVGRYSDSTQDSSLRVDIECVVDNPADLTVDGPMEAAR